MAITNLSYLRKITDGNNVIIREMVELFFQQVPEFIKNFHFYYQTGQYIALGKEAHKAKSSLQIMGMFELEQEMKTANDQNCGWNGCGELSVAYHEF